MIARQTVDKDDCNKIHELINSAYKNLVTTLITLLAQWTLNFSLCIHSSVFFRCVLIYFHMLSDTCFWSTCTSIKFHHVHWYYCSYIYTLLQNMFCTSCCFGAYGQSTLIYHCVGLPFVRQCKTNNDYWTDHIWGRYCTKCKGRVYT